MHVFSAGLAPDGQTIAYTHGGDTAYDDGILTPWLYHMESGPAPFNYPDFGLGDLPDLSFGAAAWSPDGKYLAWVVGGELTGDGEWKAGIAMFDREGQSVEILNPFVPASCLYAWCPTAPKWSSDGQWLTWQFSPAGGVPSFWITHPDGTDQQIIDYGVGPIWSPDGRLLVFTNLINYAVMVMEVGLWQPQHTGLPSNIGAVRWISINE